MLPTLSPNPSLKASQTASLVAASVTSSPVPVVCPMVCCLSRAWLVGRAARATSRRDRRAVTLAGRGLVGSATNAADPATRPDLQDQIARAVSLQRAQRARAVVDGEHDERTGLDAGRSKRLTGTGRDRAHLPVAHLHPLDAPRRDVARLSAVVPRAQHALRVLDALEHLRVVAPRRERVTVATVPDTYIARHDPCPFRSLISGWRPDGRQI